MLELSVLSTAGFDVLRGRPLFLFKGASFIASSLAAIAGCTSFLAGLNKGGLAGDFGADASVSLCFLPNLGTFVRREAFRCLRLFGALRAFGLTFARAEVFRGRSFAFAAFKTDLRLRTGLPLIRLLVLLSLTISQ